jgi:protein-S-isoprenylcysteine O-methyltransferase Ste14
MSRFIAFLYGLVAYAVFFVAFLYAIGFVENMLVPKSIDSGATWPIIEAVIVNLVLMSIFAIQHSVMARRQFKAWWTRSVPASVERTTYVLLASLVQLLPCWQWRPIPSIVWHVGNPQLASAIIVLSFVGFIVASWAA